MGAPTGGSSGSGTKSSLKLVANIFISFIGAGVLGLPYAFKEAGLAEGIIIMSTVCYLSVKAMLLLIDCKYTILASHTGGYTLLSEKGSARQDAICDKDVESSTSSELDDSSTSLTNRADISYGDVGFYAAGTMGQRVVEIALLISQIGFCCAYLIFIGENLSSFVPSVKRYTWLLFLLPLLFLLTLYRELNRLAFFSMFAQISNILAFAVVFWFDFEHIHLAKRIHPKEFSLEGFPLFFSVAIYCFEGAGMVLSLESSFAQEVRHLFRKYFVSALIVVTSLYISFGACGYLSFGRHTNAIITLNLPKGLGIDFAMLVKFCLCIALFFTYPVMMFPVTELLEKRFLHKRNLTIADKQIQENMLRLCLVALTGFIVVLVPNFANLMALVGATCCMLLAFILPAFFHYRLHFSSLTKSQRILDYVLIGLGVTGAILGTLDTLSRLSGGNDVHDDYHSHKLPPSGPRLAPKSVDLPNSSGSEDTDETTQTLTFIAEAITSQLLSVTENVTMN